MRVIRLAASLCWRNDVQYVSLPLDNNMTRGNYNLQCMTYRGGMLRLLGIAGILLMLCMGTALGVGLYVGLKSESPPLPQLNPPNPSVPLHPSNSPLGVYHDAAVTSNCAPCAKIGRDVLMEGGSAVDAAIAVLFCDGVACLQSMGLGGGFFMTIYNRTTGEVTTLNARETAPAAATEDMYHGNPELAQKGMLSMGIPGELKGYWEAHQKFGILPWSRLIEPSIKVCQEGSVLTKYQAALLKDVEAQIKESPTMSEILVDKITGVIFGAGDRIVRPGLAKTLKIIAEEGGDTLYTGSLAKVFVDDIQSMGSIFTMEDMANYQVRWEPPVEVKLSGNLTAYTMPAPSAGPLLALILNTLDGYLSIEDRNVTNHRIIEAFKWAFGQRTQLGDPHFVNIDGLLSNLTSKEFAMRVRKEIVDSSTWSDPAHYGARTEGTDNHGTAHVSILAPDGSAVSVTSTINFVLGAKVRSRKTDIILNNEMDDFSSPNITNGYGMPPSPANFIAPGKIPLSSMCPTIIVDGHGNVRLVIGSSGGTKIATSVPFVTMRNLWLNETIKQAIDAPRLHHQLFPMAAQYEYGTLQESVEALEARGHKTKRFSGGSSVIAISKQDNGEFITANADYRREAKIAGF